ncbi:amidohydrolase [Jatrophihabitans telluris]|uniref:Amidohydrolase n=1 Tax=Jatrophihabitans telluris TaxID=2038343 RepID=A0ABY4QZ37_9ACTN|nr:amidohydrolase family protein [Jatrophihabitans telluris]UQX88750.1 amidohydrolase [Jatrophihabitans telluris]
MPETADRSPARIDVHQHLWPLPFVEALRARTHVPYLRGWTLYTAGEPPYEVDAGAHRAEDRAILDPGVAQILLSLSSPLGIEALPAREAAPLLAAWHDGVLALGQPFGGWAAVSDVEPDLDGLTDHLKNGFAGLQVSATQLATPSALESLAGVLRRCEELDRPVLVHPGPVAYSAGCPPWWAAVVQYPAQLQAAWWAWHAAGRSLLPDLRVCFAAGGGLSALHHERFTARGGGAFVPDRGVFVDTSSYGRQGIDHLTRTLGIDPIVLGSDRPYAEPVDPQLGEAAWRAITVTNPQRLLEGARS